MKILKMKKTNNGKEIRVLYLGNFKVSHYPRGRTLYNGLLKNGISTELLLANSFFGYVKMFFKLIKRNYDVLLVTGKPVFLLAFFLKFWHRKKIIFDVFISDYENLVLNRKIIKKDSIFASLIWWLDKYSCQFSDYSILDTMHHVDYFCRNYNLNKKKFYVIFVGADEEFFYPRKKNKKDTTFRVVFYGSFMPGHGIDIILKAAKILEKENVKIDLIGKGQLYDKMVLLSKELNNDNVNFLGWIDYKELPKKIAEYDACLGLFDSHIPKVKRVIPTKVFEIMAMEKTCITGQNNAMTFYFKNKENIILSKMGSPSSLAKEIKWAYYNQKDANQISKRSYMLFKEKFSSVKIGSKLKEVILKYVL